MHFSDIKLPGALVAGLYKKSLVELPSYAEASAGEALTEEQKPAFTGNKLEKIAKAPAIVEPEIQATPEITPVVAEAKEVTVVRPLETGQPPAAQPAQPLAVPEQKISFLGNNQRNVLIMVSYPDETYLPEQQLQFLTRILKACNLEEKDIAIINLSNQQPTFKSLQADLKPAIMLFFGTTPAAIRLEELHAPFSPEQKEGITMAAYPALELMQGDNLLKSKLWLTLKQLFNV
jgi:hypothetical protein